MRALSHYWRITREDNAARARTAGTGDRDRSRLWQGVGLLATSHIFGAHMGWADMAMSCRSPNARRSRREPIARTPGPITVWLTYLFRRRFDDALAEFELTLQLNPNFAMAHAFTA